MGKGLSHQNLEEEKEPYQQLLHENIFLAVVVGDDLQLRGRAAKLSQKNCRTLKARAANKVST